MLAPRAEVDIDIEDIWDYAATQLVAKQAEIYVRDIQVVTEYIAAEPGIARHPPRLLEISGWVARRLFQIGTGRQQCDPHPSRPDGF